MGCSIPAPETPSKKPGISSLSGRQIVTAARPFLPHFPHVDDVPAARAAPMVEERKLKRQGAVKVVQTGAPPVKDGRLIFGLSELVVDVLIFNGFGVIAVLHGKREITCKECV